MDSGFLVVPTSYKYWPGLTLIRVVESFEYV